MSDSEIAILGGFNGKCMTECYIFNTQRNEIKLIQPEVKEEQKKTTLSRLQPDRLSRLKKDLGKFAFRAVHNQCFVSHGYVKTASTTQGK